MSRIDHWARVLWVIGPGSGLADFRRPFTAPFQNRRGGGCARVRLSGWPRPPATLLFSVELQFVLMQPN